MKESRNKREIKDQFLKLVRKLEGHSAEFV